MRAIPRLLSVMALLAALPAHAGLPGLLHEPRAGAVLRGGTTATVEWSAETLPDRAEEWEAFLSVDGGQYYAYRITPHLDLHQRRFAFVVPNVETDRARILIRAGDERDEVEIELAATFSIRQDPIRAASAGEATVDDDRRGEPARPGDLGVIQWIDGDRQGRHLAAHSALRRDPLLRPTPRIESTPDAAEAAGLLFWVEPPSMAGATRAARGRHARRSEPPAVSVDLLLVCRRRNI